MALAPASCKGAGAPTVRKSGTLRIGWVGLGGGDHPAHAPSRHAIRFREPIDDNGAVAHAVNARHGDMFRAVIENVLVNFIGDTVSIPAHAKVSNEFQLRARENL